MIHFRKKNALIEIARTEHQEAVICGNDIAKMQDEKSKK